MRARSSAGALIAFILYIDLFFSPIQQLSQVFDSWQQTRVSVGRIAELMTLDSLTPAADHALRTRAGCEGRSSSKTSASPTRSRPATPQSNASSGARPTPGRYGRPTP